MHMIWHSPLRERWCGSDDRNYFYGTMADCTLFPGSLTRKQYRKKIPEMALNVP